MLIGAEVSLVSGAEPLPSFSVSPFCSSPGFVPQSLQPLRGVF